MTGSASLPGDPACSVRSPSLAKAPHAAQLLFPAFIGQRALVGHDMCQAPAVNKTESDPCPGGGKNVAGPWGRSVGGSEYGGKHLSEGKSVQSMEVGCRCKWGLGGSHEKVTLELRVEGVGPVAESRAFQGLVCAEAQRQEGRCV